MDASRVGGILSPAAVALDSELLQLLQRGGPMTAQALAAAAAMSRTAVLRKLAALGAAGLVERRPVRRGVGRPRYQYDVTVEAHGQLGMDYGALVGSLLDAVVDVGGHELVARIFVARRRRSTALIRGRFAERGVGAAPLAERVRELAAWQDEHGFAADVSEARGLRLCQHNCPILRIATEAPAACDSELRMIAEVLEADVERESLIATGARRCIYRVMPRAKASPGPRWRAAQMSASGTVLATQPVEDPSADWRSEQMILAPSHPRGVRVTRWPPVVSPSKVVRTSPPR